MYLGTFLAAFDGTMVAALGGVISSEFGDFGAIAWIQSSFLIACAAFQPLFGKLTDIFGRRSGLIFCNIFFGVGCAVCGMSTSVWVLVAGRAIAGIGGGGLTALNTITTSDLVSLRQRGFYQGIGNLVFGAGAALGGVIGGYLADIIGWRAAFLIQVPLIIVSGFIVAMKLHIPPEVTAALTGQNVHDVVHATLSNRLRRVDFLGSFTLITSLLLFLYSLSSGGTVYAWSSPIIIACFSASLVVLAVFVYVELCIAKEPVLPLHLMTNRSVLGAALMNWFTTMAVYVVLFYTPIYFIAVLGTSTKAAGSRLISNFVGASTGSLGSGLYMRKTGKYRNLSIMASFLYVVGMLPIIFIGEHPHILVEYTALFLPGLCYACILTTTLIALIAAVPVEYQATTTSIQYAFRGTGSSIGVTVAACVFQNVLKRQLHARVTGPDADTIIESALKSIEVVSKLPEPAHSQVVTSYYTGLQSTFICGTCLAVLSFLFSFLIKDYHLHTTVHRSEAPTEASETTPLTA
ncbi:hypothetical protein CANCADRAFT_58728 [Tortispora caseinolytica NRRL Y-17796]|uniref:Major facilitator superfamily (MFS) profile domain-containing protein n=1 Tax=Tortispora caseinolytica NRRL Y-17796 TaxID=767744 RepID=A0A1E4T9M1_9ASCO|nr:hypothetical protein CANCADRAFT_58728 [Tortispora caseinolytica NRRL Y-17796]